MFITKRLTVRDTKRVYVYLPNNILGYGTSSEVYKGKDQETDTFVAIKAIYKDKYEDLGIAEVRIHKAVPSHPHIVKFLGCCQTQDNLYIITELCEGGNLRKMLNEAPNRRIKEPLAVQYLAAVVDALCVIHEEGIIHRDVKPENLFFQNGIIKLGDFGSATYADLTISHKGSPQYLAPEMMVSCVLPYDNLIDVWALGIIFYEMLYGDLPTKEGIEKLCGKGDPQENIKGYEVSVEARELLKEMLMSDPNHRITMKKVKEHALFKKHEAMKEESFLLMQGIKEVLMDKAKSAEILELLKANKLQVSIESETNELVFELEESPLKRM